MDTNALMMPVELDVRVFDELDRLLSADVDLVVPTAVLDELEKLSTGGGEEAIAASVGADLATRCRAVETEESYADDAVVELAESGETDYVVTNDKPLRDRILDCGIPVISIRGHATLAITEP
ncbi:DUF188 domain-containing protein [Haloferax sp. S1W]|uniref:DUF188 domain-containing protein n=1 Tax=Haloferax sp. S1W TaxID=3377110 RepID=UPI0037C8380B